MKDDARCEAFEELTFLRVRLVTIKWIARIEIVVRLLKFRLAEVAACASRHEFIVNV
jgi:hypothetical protein